jgi:hypothetical protein
MTQQLALKKFDFSKTDDRRVFLICSKRNSGKSQLTADLLYHKRHIPMGIIMSSTEEATGFFKGVCGIPDQYVYGEWRPEVIDAIIANQKKLAKLGKMQNCFIVLDDLAFDKKMFSSTQMRELLYNGRHVGICLIITAQFLGDLPTFFRANLDYAIALRTPGLQDRERLWKNFFGAVPTFHMFQSVMDATTEDYHCLLMDNTTQSNSLNDQIYWYKAPLRSATMNNFRIGCTAFHQFARQRGRKDKPETQTVHGKKQPLIVRRIGR